MGISREQALAQVQSALRIQFPKASFSNNADMNPATPMAITAKWHNGRIVKVVRADGINQSPDDFLKKAISTLKAFQDANVPAMALQ